MPDRAKQVGILCQRVIELLELTLTEGQSILLGESNIAHMVRRHPEDYALLFARSVYRLNTNRVQNFIKKGTLKQY